VSNDGGFMGGL